MSSFLTPIQAAFQSKGLTSKPSASLPYQTISDLVSFTKALLPTVEPGMDASGLLLVAVVRTSNVILLNVIAGYATPGEVSYS